MAAISLHERPSTGASRTYQPLSQSDQDPLPQSQNTTGLSKDWMVKRKPVPQVSVDPDCPSSTDTHNLQRRSARNESGQDAVWKPNVWTRLPSLALLSLVGVLACTAAAIAVLVISDGAGVESWSSFTPSVYLAVFSVIANSLLGFALTEGLVISFWRFMLRGGTIAEIERNWRCGSFLSLALTQGFRRGGRVTAIARIVTLLSLFRGPLYQRASTVYSNHLSETRGNMALQLAQHLPEGYAGVSVYTRASGVRDTSRLTSAFTEIMNDYSLRSNMTMEHDDCGDTCSTTVKGFGFKVDCEIIDTSTDYNTSAAHVETLFDSSVELYRIAEKPDDITTFWAGLQLNATFYEGDQEDIGTSTTIRLHLKSHICNLTGGLVEYEIDLAKGVITLSPSENDRFIQAVDLLSPSHLGGNTTIGGFQYAGDFLFSSTATVSFAGAVSSTILQGSLANQMLDDTTATVLHYTFKDPMNIMLGGLREIAFRASLKAGKENATETGAVQTVQFTGHKTYSIYRTDYIFLVLAVTMSVIGVATIGGTFYGWWQLGRNVSMSPLELAKAFRAPLLENAGSNVSFEGYPTQLRDRAIRYGVVEGARELGSPHGAGLKTECLAVGDVGGVRDPVPGNVYSR